MTSLYAWLLFVHLSAVVAFLLAHGVSATAGFMARSGQAASKPVLQLSMRSAFVSNPALLVIIATGVWMGFIESWWRTGWIWTAIIVLVAVMVVMGLLSRPFYAARSSDGGEFEKNVARTRPEAMALVGSIALFVLVFLMVFKPF
ncbi:MAG TPA: hypothetical protein VFL29_08110 [Candidatus Dormibacteraeota bacterium]|nr:hypothetical protein [Candidatus Dormibacteraeota bacterium]